MSGQPTPPPVSAPSRPAPPAPHHSQVRAAPHSLFGATTGVNRQAQLHGLTPKQIQTLLRSRGYHVQVDGKLGPQTKAAMDAYIGGKPAKQFNTWAKVHFSAVAPHTLFGAQTGNLAPHPGGRPGAPSGSRPSGGKPVTGSRPGGGLGFDPNSVGEMLPEDMAGQIAGLQFDPQIHSTQRALDALPGERAQNLSDISHWYGQVLDSQGTAATRDKEISTAGTNSVKDAVASIIASLGGGANQGAGVVGGAGANAVGTLAATGAAQDQYNEDIRPLLQSESAGASTRESARLSQKEQDTRAALTDLLGQKGAARAAALLDIKDKNNQLEQTRFSDALAYEQTRQAALLTGAKLASLGASVGGRVSPNTLGKASNGAMNQFAVTDDSGNVTGYKPPTGMSVQQVVQKVNNAYLGLGLSLHDPAVAQSAMATLRSLGISADPRWYGQGH